MSHFCVLVITDEIGREPIRDALDPFSEHVHQSYEPLSQEDLLAERTEFLIECEKMGLSGAEIKDEKIFGRFLSCKYEPYGEGFARLRNPLARWDAWKVGGRYRGLLFARARNGKIFRTNSARMGEILIQEMIDSVLSEADETWTFYKDQQDELPGIWIILKMDPNIPPSKWFAARDERPALANAILLNGIWYQNEKGDDARWSRKFWSVMDQIPGDKIVNVVDCHI